MGGIFGLLVGAAVLFVPGFGPLIVVGPAAAWLLGGIEGAIVGAAGGGILGGLVGLGVSRDHIVQSHLERNSVQGTAHPNAQGNVVSRTATFQLIDKPQPLLTR